MSLTAQITRTILVTAAVCLLTPNSAVAQDEPEQKNQSIIRGVVTYADTGRPVRFTAVIVMRNHTGFNEAGTITDGRGQFEVRRLPAGRYLIFAGAPGLLTPTDYERNMGSVSSQLRLNQTRDLFTEVVVNGTDSVDVKVQAVRGGVITGRVVNEEDQPVGGAEVKLLKRENDKWVPLEATWRGGPEGNRTTDPSGVYRIAGLNAGEYLVRVTESTLGFDGSAYEEGAYDNGSLMVAYYPAATMIKEAQAVSVVEGIESTGIDIRMPDRISRTLSGAVTFGANDQPAPFVSVLVEHADEFGFLGVGDTPVVTDNEGKWAVHGVPAGKYVVRFGGTVRVGSEESGSHVYVAPKRMAVTVANADVVLSTRVVEAATVSGRVKIDGPPPENRYEMRPGVVLARDGSERPGNQSLRSNRYYNAGYVRDNGTFEIRGLAAGKYWFAIGGFRADEYYVKSVTRKGVDLGQNAIKLDTGAQFGDIVVTLGTDIASIEGQLSNAKPTAGETKITPGEMVVMIAPANDATRRFSPGLQTSQPDDQGRFVFACGPGEYFITVFTRSQREKFATPITDDYFKNDNQKFLRVKVRAGEKLKGVTLPIGVN